MSDTPDTIGESQRQQAVDRLCEAFADDRMEVEEFERRVELAHRAATVAELQRLLADLPAPPPPVPAKRPPASGADPGRELAAAAAPARRLQMQAPEAVRENSFVAGVMGGATRKGTWRPARINYAVGIMGGFELDFREAVLPPGVTEVRVFAFWGGGEIIVPPEVVLEVSALGLMGGFEETHYAPSSAAPNAPVIRVTGVAIMGGAEINVRYAGESKGDAKRRTREEKKRRKRLGRGGGS